MPRVCFIISEKSAADLTAQAAVLGKALQRQGIDVDIAVFGPACGIIDALQRSDIQSPRITRYRSFPFGIARLIRQLHTSKPDLVHCWGEGGLYAIGALFGRNWSPIILTPSWALSSGKYLTAIRFLRGLKSIIAQGTEQEQQLTSIFSHSIRIETNPPPICTNFHAQSPASGPKIDDSEPSIVCYGPLEPDSGLYTTICTYDVVRHAYPNLIMEIVGVGSQRRRLQQLIEQLHLERFISIRPPVPDENACLKRATVVWVTGNCSNNRVAVLDAMALGRPVIASNAPGISELICSGETGIVTKANDIAALARDTKRLLDDTNLRWRLGTQAAQFVCERFSPARFVQRYESVYHSVAPMVFEQLSKVG